MKKKPLFSRYVLSIIMIAAEIGGIIALFSVLAHYAGWLWIAAFITSFAAYLVIINHDMNPEFKITWLSIVLLLPPFGALLFSMFYRRRTVSDYDRYLSATDCSSAPQNGGYFIPFGSGPQPAFHCPVGKNVFLNIINQAQYYVYITTPYLIIDYDLTTALQNAAVRGVDVRIITPHIPDKKLVQLLTRTAYPALMNSGVHIYEYTPGFIHQKTVLSDDLYAVVGTINFDYRSLVHHYENAVWIYGADVLRDIWTDFDRTFEVSEEIGQNSIKMTLLQKILRDCIRLFAPLF